MKASEMLRRHGARALGELALIVVGVTTAFWVESLKERRDAGREEYRYLLEMRNDFADNVTQLEQILAAEREGESAAIALLGAVHTVTADPNADSVRVWFLRSLFSGGYAGLAQGTFVGLIETGSLGLVQDDSLRTMLAAYASQLPRDLELMRYWDDTAFQLLVTNAYFKREIGVFELYGDQLKQSRGLPLSNRFPVDFKRLVTEKQFGGLAADAYLMRRNRRLAVNRLLRNTRAVLGRIDRVLEGGT